LTSRRGLLAVTATAMLGISLTLVPVSGAAPASAVSAADGDETSNTNDTTDSNETSDTNDTTGGAEPTGGADTTGGAEPTGDADTTDGNDTTGDADTDPPAAPGAEDDIEHAVDVPRAAPPSELGRPAWAVTNPNFSVSPNWSRRSSLVSDSFGNTFVAGTFERQIAIRSSVAEPIPLDAGSGEAVYVARYTPDGTAAAAKVIAFDASVDTIGDDPLGHIYVVAHGASVSIPTALGTRVMGRGTFLVKLRNDLSSVWAVKITNDFTTAYLPVAVDGNTAGEVAVVAFGTVARVRADGRIATSRRTGEVVDLALGEDGTMYEALQSAQFLRASSPAGSWTLGKSWNAFATSVAIGTDGEITVGGYVKATTSFGVPGADHVVQVDRPSKFVMRVRPDGAPAWSAVLDPAFWWTPTDPTSGPVVEAGTAGDVVAAYYEGNGISLVRRLDTTGTIVANTTVRYDWGAVPPRVAIGTDGSISVAGWQQFDTTLGSAPDQLLLPRPPSASTYLAHWGPPTPAPSGSLQVDTSYLGAGQSGVSVGVTPSGATPGAVQWQASGSDGSVRFESLAPGPYRVTVLDWEGRFERAWFDGEDSFASATDVPVRPGASAAVTMILLVRPQSGIAGTIRDDAGAPLPGMVAQVFTRSGFVRSTKTSSSGAYLVTGLSGGTYWVRFVDPSGRHLPQWFDGAGSPADRTPVAVGSDLAQVDATMHPRRVDVAVDVSFTSSTARGGDPFPLMVDVANLGPDAVTSIDLRPIVPAGMTIQGVEGESGNAIAGGWRTGPLAAGASTYVMITVGVGHELTTQQVEVGATASVAAIDLQPDNDTSIRPVRVVGGSRPHGLWAQSIHGPGEAITYGVAVDREGNTYASGWFRGMVTFGEGAEAVTWVNNRPVPDMWFAKFDVDGHLVWVRRGAGFDRLDPTGGGVAVAADGALYVTGFFEGEAVFGEGADQVRLSSWGGTQMFLVRFTPEGRVSWARQHGQWAYGWTVSIAPNGDAWVAGRENTWSYNWQTSLGTYSQGFVIAYNPAGQVVRLLSQTSRSSQTQAMARSATVDDDGTVYVVGTLGTDMTFGGGTSKQVTLHGRGGYDGFLAIYEADGTLRSVTQVGGAGATDRLSGVRAAGDGDTYVSGNLEAGATIGSDPTPLTTTGGYLIRLAPDGTSRWTRSLGANVRQVVTDRFGALYVMGGIDSGEHFDRGDVPQHPGNAGNPADPGDPGNPSEVQEDRKVWGAEDAYLAKFYPDGTFDWIVHGGGPRRDVAFTAAVDHTGLVHIGGSTSALAVFCLGPDASIARSQGKTNAFVATCAPPHGIEHPWNDNRVTVVADAAVGRTGADAISKSLTATVTNHGPYASTATDLTFTLPPGAVIGRLSSSTGTVTDAVWHLPSLASGTSATISAEVILPPQAQPITMTVGANLEATDLVPWNNHALATFDIVSPPPAPTTTTPPTTSPPTTPPTTRPTTPPTTGATAPPTTPARVSIPLPQLVFGPTTAVPRPSTNGASTRGQGSNGDVGAATPTPTSATSGSTTTTLATDERRTFPASATAGGATGSEPSDDSDDADDAGESANGPITGPSNIHDERGLGAAAVVVSMVAWLVAAASAGIVWRRRRTGAAEH